MSPEPQLSAPRAETAAAPAAAAEPRAESREDTQIAPVLPPASAAETAYELCIVVPTFNERDNIGPLIETLEHSLDGIAWEAIIVDDDSPDGTAEEANNLSSRHPNVRCIHRIGRRGLSSACIEGMMASAAPYLAVVDGDLQHDIGILKLMLLTLKRDGLDIVVGSRYVDGGGTGNWAESRLKVSQFATRLTQRVLRRVPLADPMSGFFVIRRDTLHGVVRRMNGKGFKILLDIFLSADRPLRYAELPYTMRARERGDSKLDALVAWEFLMLLADKMFGWLIPVRFVMFIAVGCVGAVGHLAVLGLLHRALETSFLVGQTTATAVAMTINFFLNNAFTHRDRKLRGRQAIRGLVSFYIACGLGAGVNVALADFLFGNGIPWWIAALLGALTGAVWNFVITSSFTWQRKPGRSETATGATPR